MIVRSLIRVGGGSVIAVIVATALAGGVLAREIVRGDEIPPAAKPASGITSSSGENSAPASPRLGAHKPSIAETNEIEGMRLAAEHGVARAQLDLGLRYETGRGVARDPVQAINWFRKAAEQDYDEAQYTLGCCYNGDDGFDRNPSEAVKWWGKAAAQGHTDAQYCLGLSYAIGEGVAKDPAEAAKWWIKAAAQGHADAQYFVGLSYSTGLGVPKTRKLALYWLGQAAAQGNESARAALKKLEENREISAGESPGVDRSKTPAICSASLKVRKCGPSSASGLAPGWLARLI